VARAIQNLHSTPSIKVACVIGFHEGTQSTSEKVSEAKKAVEAGATELDVVLNRGLLAEGSWELVFQELKAIRGGAPEGEVVLKLILETSQLDEGDVVEACLLAGYAGFDFVKTSTGFCGRGASLADVVLMSACAGYLAGKGVSGGKRMKVKASGGIRGFEDAVAMIGAGAERIGASSGVKIVQEARDGGDSGKGLSQGSSGGEGGKGEY